MIIALEMGCRAYVLHSGEPNHYVEGDIAILDEYDMDGDWWGQVERTGKRACLTQFGTITHVDNVIQE